MSSFSHFTHRRHRRRRCQKLLQVLGRPWPPNRENTPTLLSKFLAGFHGENLLIKILASDGLGERSQATRAF